MRTLEELDVAVSSLEKATAADQLVPGVFSLDEEGALQEKLRGTLEALGITLPLGQEAVEKITDESKILWLNPSGETISSLHAIRETISSSNIVSLDVKSGLAGVGKPATLILSAADELTEYKKLEFAGRVPIGGEFPLARPSTLIYDNHGNSNFLQLAGEEPKLTQVTAGKTEVEWEKGYISKATTVAGLPACAALYVVAIADIYGTSVHQVSTTAFEVAAYQLVGGPELAPGTKAIVRFIALGVG